MGRVRRDGWLTRRVGRRRILRTVDAARKTLRSDSCMEIRRRSQCGLALAFSQTNVAIYFGVLFTIS